MTYFPDLSPCTYFDRDLSGEWWASYLIAVGWLDPEQTKPHCDVPPPDAILDTLFNLVTDSWPPIGFLGYHACGFCPNAPPRTATEVNHKGPMLKPFDTMAHRPFGGGTSLGSLVRHTVCARFV